MFDFVRYAGSSTDSGQEGPEGIQIRLVTEVAGRLVSLDSLPRVDVVAGAAAVPVRTAIPEIAGLLEILRSYRATSVERAFGDGGSGLYEQLSPAQIEGRLACFNVYFKPGADLVRVVREVSRLDSVMAAIPLPGEAPPAVVLDPLTGTGDGGAQTAGGLPTQWYLFRCRAPEAWNGVLGPQTAVFGRGTVIADIDFGFRTDHQEFTNLTTCYNSADGSTKVDVGAYIAHGTGVLGLAGAAANGVGIMGFAPEAEIWAIQANQATERPLGGDKWVRGIDFVRTSPAGDKRKVLILEVEGKKGSSYEALPAVRLALQNAIEQKVVVVLAAGNGSREAGKDANGIEFPESGAILVGATVLRPSENLLGRFSNFGPRITLCAPGDPKNDLTCSSAGPDQYRANFGGTSGAAPKVAGACALMLEADPTLTHSDVKTILRETGSPVICPAGIEAGTFLNVSDAVRRVFRG